MFCTCSVVAAAPLWGTSVGHFAQRAISRQLDDSRCWLYQSCVGCLANGWLPSHCSVIEFIGLGTLGRTRTEEEPKWEMWLLFGQICVSIPEPAVWLTLNRKNGANRKSWLPFIITYFLSFECFNVSLLFISLWLPQKKVKVETLWPDLYKPCAPDHKPPIFKSNCFYF